MTTPSRQRQHRRQRRLATWALTGVSLALLIGLGAGTAAVVVQPQPAAAHAVLQSTEPGAGSTMDQASRSITLRFDEQVEVSFGSVRVYDTNAKRVDEGNPSHPAGDGHAVRLPVPRLTNGSYVVTWRVISADSHPVHGAFTFRVGSGQAADTRSLTHRLLASQGGSASVGTVFAIDRVLAFASVIALIGGCVFLLGPWPGGRGDRRAGRVIGVAWCTAVISTLVGIPLQGLYAGALPLSKITDPSITSSVLDTRFGKVWLARAVLLVLLVPVLRAIVRPSRHGVTSPLLLAAGAGGLLLASSFGLASHPGTGSMVPLAVLADTAHVSAVSVWLGGLLLLTLCLLGQRGAPDGAAIVRRFSPIAFWAVAAIAATGLYQGWREVGSLNALQHTTYGRLLIIKLLLFGGLLALAATSRKWVREPRPGAARALAVPETAPDTEPVLVGAGAPAGAVGADARSSFSAGAPAADLRDIRRSVAAEVAVAIAVLVVTSLLVNAQPGRTALAQPFSTELDTKSVLIDVTVDPAKAGPTTLHVYTLSPEGAVKDVKELSAELELPGKDIGPLTVPLRRAGSGHFSAYGFDLPIAGRWRLTVRALVSDFDQAQASTIIPVH